MENMFDLIANNGLMFVVTVCALVYGGKLLKEFITQQAETNVKVTDTNRILVETNRQVVEEVKDIKETNVRMESKLDYVITNLKKEEV